LYRPFSTGPRSITRNRSAKLITGVAVFATAALVLAGCTGGPDAAADDAETPDSIVIATPSSPTHFFYDAGTNVYPAMEIEMQINSTLLTNPYAQDEQDENALRQQVYEFEGALAESYEVSEDGLVYTFNLREGVVSQAGNPFTADDVIWSFNQKFENPTAVFQFVSAPAMTDPSTQIAKVDDFTVTMTVADRGYGQTLLSLLSNVTAQVFDSTILQENATPDDPFGVAWARANPTVQFGYGAYMIDSFTPDSDTTLVANPNYWGDAPAIDTVIYRVVADSATRAQSLRNGDVDIAENLAPQEQADAQTTGGVDVFSLDTNIYSFMVPVTNKAPFDNALVRQAMAYAIPYDQILDNVYLGRATQPTGYLDSNAPGYTDANLPEYAYDPEKSLELLEEAGYPDGVEYTLTVNADTPDLVAAAVQMQAEAADAGFTIDIDQQPSAAFSAGRTAGDFQSMLLRDYAITLTPPYELNLFTTRNSSLNYPKWEDETFYGLMDAAQAEGDPISDAAGAVYNEAEVYMLEQAPLIIYAQVQPSFAVADTLTGWAWRSDNWLDLSQLSYK